MTLYDILPKDGSETGVTDIDYDIEVYFYYTENGDAWDNAMMDLAKLLTVDHVTPSGNISVNLATLIDAHIGDLSGLFINVDIDSIMDDIEPILAGNVSEEWMCEFVNILGKGVE